MEGQANYKKLYSIKDMSYFLTDIIKERKISILSWSEGINVSKSTARWHLKVKRIPDPKCWGKIARFLKIPMSEIVAFFREDLRKQGRILYCEVCRTEFYRFKRTRLCGAPNCARTYERIRKALKRKNARFTKLINKSTKWENSSSKKKFQITHKELDQEIKRYIKTGGKIQYLNPTIADGIAGELWDEQYSARQVGGGVKADQEAYQNLIEF